MKKKRKNLQKKIGAIYKLTSAADGQGVKEFFEELGNKFLDSNNIKKIEEDRKSRGNSLKIKKGDTKENVEEKKKKKCC